MWGLIIAGVVALLVMIAVSIAVFAQHFWLPILIVLAAVAVRKSPPATVAAAMTPTGHRHRFDLLQRRRCRCPRLHSGVKGDPPMANWLDTITGVTAPGAARKQSEAEVWPRRPKRRGRATHRSHAAGNDVVGMGPVLRRGERAFFQGGANYRRMYGGDGTYTTTGLLALGNPAFMLGAFAASGIINHRRKARARRDAAVQWRDYQRAGIIATSQRLMVHRPRLGDLRIRRDHRVLPGYRKLHPHHWIRRSGRADAPRRPARARHFGTRGRRHHARPVDTRPSPALPRRGRSLSLCERHQPRDSPLEETLLAQHFETDTRIRGRHRGPWVLVRPGRGENGKPR